MDQPPRSCAPHNAPKNTGPPESGSNAAEEEIPVLLTDRSIYPSYKPSALIRTRNLSNLVKIPISSNVMSSTSTLEMGNNFQNTRLKIAHLNIRSLKSNTHLTQLRDLSRRENFDILTISETWLNPIVFRLPK
jgi:hypothetical protein